VSLVTGISNATGTADDIRSSYLNLLVTQLKNQNPLEPMSTNEMASQLAQLSQLEQMEQMNSSFAEVLKSQRTREALELIGKTVTFVLPDSEELHAGIVNRVDIGKEKITVTVGEQSVDLDDIRTVQQ